jgi:hypothetical protein
MKHTQTTQSQGTLRCGWRRSEDDHLEARWAAQLRPERAQPDETLKRVWPIALAPITVVPNREAAKNLTPDTV